MLSLTLGSKSCCHQETIYSSRSRHPAYSVSFLGEHRDTDTLLHKHTQVQYTYKYERHSTHTLPHRDLHQQNNWRILVFSHFIVRLQNHCSAPLQSNCFTGLEFDLYIGEPWFRWAKQNAAPNSTSVSPLVDGAIHFSQRECRGAVSRLLCL